MGKGNPESADAAIARESAVFIADKLSDTNKKQLNNLGIQWVELRGYQGLKGFAKVLDNLNIPHSSLSKDIKNNLDSIFDRVFSAI